MSPGATAVVALVAVSLTGCSGGSKHTALAPKPGTTTVSTRPDTETMLERAVRAALNENFRLSLYVLWHNRLPSWARHSTRGPALASLRSSAAARRRQGVRIRSQAGRYMILRLQLDPSYARATAAVRDRRHVVLYRAGRRVRRSIAVDDHARIELRRIGNARRFVVWRVSPVR